MSTDNRQDKYIAEPTQMEERATLAYPEKEIKETAPSSHTEVLTQNTTPQRQLKEKSILGHRNNQKAT